MILPLSFLSLSLSLFLSFYLSLIHTTESLMIGHNETLEVLAIKDLHSKLDDNKDGQVDYEESTEVIIFPFNFLLFH